MNAVVIKFLPTFARHRILLSLAIAWTFAPLAGWAAAFPGRLANPGFVNQRIKATYFFSGQALDGSNFCRMAIASSPLVPMAPPEYGIWRLIRCFLALPPT